MALYRSLFRLIKKNRIVSGRMRIERSSILKNSNGRRTLEKRLMEKKKSRGVSVRCVGFSKNCIVAEKRRLDLLKGNILRSSPANGGQGSSVGDFIG